MRKKRENMESCVKTDQMISVRSIRMKSLNLKVWIQCICIAYLVFAYLGTPLFVNAQGNLPLSEQKIYFESVEDENIVVEESCVYTVNDEAGLLSEDEVSELEQQVISLVEKTGWNVGAFTIDDAQGLSTLQYADTCYNEWAGVDTDGFLVLIDMDNREIYISTSGIAIRYLYDTRIEDILDEGYYYISNGEYADCLEAMIRTAEHYYEEGIPEDQYNYDVETGAVSEYRVLTWMEAVPVLLVAAFSGIGIYWGVSKSYSVKGSISDDYPLTKYGSVDLIAKEDHFIRKNITHQRIQKNTSSGGTSGGGHRSSVHRSGGGSHGGGGRKF